MHYDKEFANYNDTMVRIEIRNLILNEYSGKQNFRLSCNDPSISFIVRAKDSAVSDYG